MRKIVPDNWNTNCDGKEGTVMGRRGQGWEGGDSDGKEGTVMGRRGQ